MTAQEPAPTTGPDAAPTGPPPGLETVPTDRRVVVVCRPGGVGKTTVAAAMALEGARRGRRACVVTVDPARRLADSLGVESLPNTPAAVAGDWAGELFAVMLDTKGTFDDLVARYAKSTEQVQSIRSNRLYQNLAGALSGTQEYMAMEKLYELTESGEFDVVVVDTPPTRNALDLLDAPRRLTQFLENRLFRALLMPTRAGLRAVGVATRAVLRTIAKVAGAEIVDDAVAFFQAFAGMEDGFRTRARTVRALLMDPATAYVLVTSPRPDAVEETAYFAGKLEDTGVTTAGLVVNRVHPRFDGGEPAAAALTGAVPDGSAPTPPAVPVVPEGTDLAAMVANLVDLNRLADREEAAYEELVARVAPAPVGRVPLLRSDVHDVGGLASVADHLFG